MRHLLRRARALWRRTFPRGTSYSSDIARQQRVGRGPTIDGPGSI